MLYIVEDDVNIRQMESYALKNSGFHVEEFPDAKAFFERLSVKLPNLVLLDVMLPDEDGLSVVAKLRKRSRGWIWAPTITLPNPSGSWN